MNEIARLTVRMSNDLKSNLEKFAEQHNTTLNALITETLQEKLKNSNQSASNKNIKSEKDNNENFEILQDKVDFLVDFLLQQQEKLKEEIKQEMQKEILEDFKIFANILAKKIQEILAKDTTSYLTIKRPLVFEAVKNFAEQNKKPFLQKCDLIAAIDFSQETTELKIYKILEAESYNNIKAVNIKNEQEKITIDLTNKVHYLSLLQIYKKI